MGRAAGPRADRWYLDRVLAGLAGVAVAAGYLEANALPAIDRELDAWYPPRS